MNDKEKQEMEMYRAAFQRMADQSPVGIDLMGRYVKNCVRCRQIVCRDQSCVNLGRCKRFPADLLPSAPG